ncbi:hypothetical protein KSP40_PGU007794 [Platanthera guangdongensis]|uniref:Uncharacterized protein n=1 Tax=Platanthera guangdongensis TaxID=2320717 RepID=A0ABR2LKU2_9ASPA
MEGLIPFLFHAFKKNRRDRGTYRSLSDASSGGGSRKELMLDWAAQEGSSHHRRTRSDFPPASMADSAFLTGDPRRKARDENLSYGRESY